jgi:acyl-coenzyme A thioesterase PaaI-like protein
LSATPPTILAELIVSEEHVNDKTTMHGGCTAALVDILTATSVRLLVPENPIVSIDLSVRFVNYFLWNL